jgi:hypothetical protein
MKGAATGLRFFFGRSDTKGMRGVFDDIVCERANRAEEIISIVGFLDVDAETALEQNNDFHAIKGVEAETFAEEGVVISDFLRLDVFKHKVGHEELLEFGADQREQFLLGKIGNIHCDVDFGASVVELSLLV